MAHRVNFDSRRTLLLLAALGGVGAVASFSVDQSCSQSLRSLELPGDLGKAIQLSEVFAHGIGVAAILGTLLLVAKHQRSAVLGTILITAAAGLTANLAKQTVVRIRPNSQGKIQVERQVAHNQFGRASIAAGGCCSGGAQLLGLASEEFSLGTCGHGLGTGYRPEPRLSPRSMAVPAIRIAGQFAAHREWCPLSQRCVCGRGHQLCDCRPAAFAATRSGHCFC